MPARKALLPAVLLVGVALGQYALDNNLRVGSGKVNEYNRPGFQRELYRPAVIQSAPVYVRSDSGEMVYSPQNAFNPVRPYTPNPRPYGPQSPYTQTGFSQDRGSNAYMARFRGY